MGVYTKRGRGVDCVNSDIPHGVPTHLFQEPRVPIAMDVYVDSNALQEQKDLVAQGVMSKERFIHLSA